MSKINNERILFDLIHSMTKSEKRSFKLHVKRSTGIGNTKFVKLFDIMGKMPEYNEVVILKKLQNISKSQFSNLKSHLYSQLLASLRQNFLNHDVDIQLREQLDYIRLLYKKGLYGQSLRLLSRAKKITGYYRKDLFQLSLLDYEKQIRSQQVFDLEERQMSQLDIETQESMQRFTNVQHFFSLAIKLKARFVECGIVKNEAEMNDIKALFQENMIVYDDATLAFNERFYLYRAYYWYSYLIYDFHSCMTYAEKWVQIFEDSGLYKSRTAGFLKGLNRLLQSTFRVQDHDNFEKYFHRLVNFSAEEGTILESNAQILLLKYKSMQTFNRVFLNGCFEESRKDIIENIEQVSLNSAFVDKHSLLIINYKAGIYFFTVNEYDQALSHLDFLILDSENLRNDLKAFARIVQLIIYYESADDDRLERAILTTYNFLRKQENLIEFHVTILEFIKKLDHIFPQDILKGFKILKERLEQLKANKYQTQFLLYFDIISWLDAKIEGKTFAEIVKRKILKN